VRLEESAILCRCSRGNAQQNFAKCVALCLAKIWQLRLKQRLQKWVSESTANHSALRAELQAHSRDLAE